ncbi:monothiol glutaredoxin-S10-like [Olea europaea var. sylvestris]|uniref:monothiol glutaredoxin-S10-like n=1 Tax=Olea europaea var. sylvestris TaxID=158386 RepID=UPI000C1D6EDF|nr:monothiol glutaredoxin-S10-like [Olea europaea var. sylvestris]
MDRIANLASQKAMVMSSKSTCCMCHSIKKLFYEQGVSPTIYKLNKDSRGKEIEWALMRLGCSYAIPAVFINGQLLGSADTLVTLHLDGSLKKLPKDAGDIWL